MIGLLVQGLVYLQYLPAQVVTHAPFEPVNSTALKYGPKGELVGIVTGVGLWGGILFNVMSFAIVYTVGWPIGPTFFIVPDKQFWLSTNKRKEVLVRTFRTLYQIWGIIFLSFFLFTGFVVYISNLNSPPTTGQWWFILVLVLFIVSLILLFVLVAIYLRHKQKRLEHQKEKEPSKV